MRKLRVAFRCCRILNLLIWAALDYFFLIKLAGNAASLTARSQWLKFWSNRWLRIMNCRVHWQGNPPASGMLTSNHLSYMDVLVLASICPLVFLSKAEVASWPVVGMYTKFAGTLYIHRQNKNEVVRLGADMVPVVKAGLPVAIFLEGTSTSGDDILPFRSPLLAPAEGHNWPVTPAFIHYTMPEGAVRQEIAYWGGMTFFPHIINLFGRPGFEAFVQFDAPLTEKLDRKEMARQLHARVCKMREAHAAKTIVAAA